MINGHPKVAVNRAFDIYNKYVHQHRVPTFFSNKNKIKIDYLFH